MIKPFAAIALLSLGAAAATPGSDAGGRARSLVAKCETVRIPDGVGFRCPGVLVHLSETAAPSEEAALQQALSMLRGAFKLDGPETPASFEIAGSSHPGARFTVASDAPQAAGTRGFAAAWSPSAGVARAITCLQPETNVDLEKRCRVMIDALGSVGPAFFAPSVTDAALLTPSFLGKSVPVPQGCKVQVATPDGFDVECDGHTAVRYLKQATADEARKSSSFLLRQMLGQAGAAPGAVLKCSIGGVPATCDVVVQPGVVTVLGTATVQGQPVVASCSRGGSAKGVPKVCAPVLKF